MCYVSVQGRHIIHFIFNLLFSVTSNGGLNVGSKEVVFHYELNRFNIAYFLFSLAYLYSSVPT